MSDIIQKGFAQARTTARTIQEGYNARVAGKSLVANPYPENSTDSHNWIVGWTGADEAFSIRDSDKQT